jgi:hypothetical protein
MHKDVPLAANFMHPKFNILFVPFHVFYDIVYTRFCERHFVVAGSTLSADVSI